MNAAIPSGSSSWFVCRTSKMVDDILLPIKDGVAASDEVLANKGRIFAAREFKRRHGLHPCTKVEVEFQGVESADGMMLDPRR